MRLDPTGRALVARSVSLSLVASVSVCGARAAVVASGRGTLVAESVKAPRPVYFDSSLATLRPGERAYLNQLRANISGVQAVRCDGFTDSRGSAEDVALSGNRAKVRGRSLDRRTDIRFGY